jgi:DNA gyrase subunit A
VVEADVVDAEAKYVFTVTENGMGKLSSIEDYREQGRGGSGVKAGSMTAKTGDIIGVHLITEALRKEGEVILISRNGQTVRVPLGTIRVTSRVTQGVILAKLKTSTDAFTSMTVTTKEDDSGEAGNDEQTEIGA